MGLHTPEAVQIVALDGEWDLSRGLELRRRLEAVVAHPLAIIDLSDSVSIDANCLTMLLRMCAQRAAKGYRTAGLVVPLARRRLLGPLPAQTLWLVFDSVDEALAHFSHSGNIPAVEST